MKFTFQHLECVNPSKTDQLCVIGRTSEGKSIAARINNVKPHICVLNHRGHKAHEFQQLLNAQIHLVKTSIRIDKDVRDKEKESVLNFKYQLSKSKEYVTVSQFDAQDIINWNEDGPVSFFKITLESKYLLTDVKKILRNNKMKILQGQTWGVEDKKTGDQHNQKIFDAQKRYLPKKKEDSYHKSVLKCEFQYMHCGICNDSYTLYNDQVDFMLQYFIDNDIYSSGWLEAEGKILDVADRITSCDIEVEVTSICENRELSGLAPWRIFSYDIESLPPPRKNQEGKYDFPSAENDDPVVTVGGVLQVKDEVKQFVWILRPFGEEVTALPKFETEQDCDYAPESTIIYNFDTEGKLVKHFFEWCVDHDVDMIQGHNCNRFDNAYMLTRYEKIFKQRPTWGRFTQEPSFIEEKTFSSAQKGTNKQYKLHLPGRVILDSYDIMKDQHNEASYKLDDLAATYLGTRKVPFSYDTIYPKYHTLEGRIDLAVYCVKDAWLVYKLLDKLCKLIVITQMAHVTGIGMKDIMARGQGIRTIALMLRYAKRETPQMMLPRLNMSVKTRNVYRLIQKDNQLQMGSEVEEISESFQGATVVEPLRGFYKRPVSCLDFASLYPSIMQALNMCYSTKVNKHQIKHHDWKQDVDVRTIPDFEEVDGQLKVTENLNNPSFVMKNVRQGLLPKILETVLMERKKVKKQRKGHDPNGTMYKVLDGTQLALKVVANSIYGFTGATFGFLPDKDIAQSVTKYGRFLIARTKETIENHPEWGKKGAGCYVIYGDTDSVFIRMPEKMVYGDTDEEIMNKAHEVGEMMGEYVTKIFIPPIFLEYEKTYKPYLLLKKKRYAGLKAEPGLPTKLHIKGLESVRRDFAPLTVDTQKRVLNALIIDQDEQKACDIVADVVYKLNMNEIPLDMLIMSKKLSRPVDEYKAKAPHVELTKRLMRENPDIAPVSGDRVPFVIFSGSGGSSDRACTPEEITSGKYIIDRSYYLENQLKKPLLRILERVVKDPEQLFKCRSIFQNKISKTNIFSKWVKSSGEKRSKVVTKGIMMETKGNKKTQMDISNFFKSK